MWKLGQMDVWGIMGTLGQMGTLGPMSFGPSGQVALQRISQAKQHISQVTLPALQRISQVTLPALMIYSVSESDSVSIFKSR